MMMAFPRSRSLAVAVAVIGVSALVAPTAATALTQPAQSPAPHDVTSPVEAQRVDSVQATVEWKTCGISPNQECALINVPMDYDKPSGPTMLVQAQRNKTSKPGQKKGDLWIVDGSLSPTRSDVEFPENFLSPDILDNFDVVGIQPRGTFKVEYTGVQCFKDVKEQGVAMRRLQMSHPVNPADQDAYLRMTKLAAERCSTKGMPIASHLSIAQQVRDLEVMRRLFSKDKITMMTRPDGAQVAQTYAAMFPDRVRAIFVNGAIDPVQYTGGVGQHALRTVRTNQDVAAQRAVDRIFTWCDKKGAEQCPFAKNAPQGTAAKFKSWYDELMKKPVITPIPEMPFDSGSLAELVFSYGRGNAAPREVGNILEEVWADTHATPKNAKAASAKLGALVRKLQAGKQGNGTRQDAPKPTPAPSAPPAPAPSTPAPAPTDPPTEEPEIYNNFTDTWLIGMCSEGQQVSEAQYFKSQIAETKQRSPMFGELAAWPLSACVSDQWKAVDQQQYRGDFTAKAAVPLLFGASRFSTIHDLSSAQAAARRSPGGVLITNEGWGADPYWSSRCLAKVADAYLISGTLPKGNQSCEPDWKDELPVQR